MTAGKRLRDYALTVGSLEPGPLNAITDVEGVRVGHCTLSDGPIQTGVTAILPHGGNLFKNKTPAACHVINGFGKSIGVMQVEEMGSLETPIVLTNTLSVGMAADALVEYMLESNAEIGRSEPTVNPVVCECNDGYLNDIRGRRVGREQVRAAIASASREFLEGAVGAGTGMSCFELKGGIGSSSRLLSFGREGEPRRRAIGALTLTNFGLLGDLSICGIPVGGRIAGRMAEGSGGGTSYRRRELGSIIVVLATDLPLSERQLGRVARRAVIGIARTGSFMGNGSGELVLAFSTAPLLAFPPSSFEVREMLREELLDEVFRAAAEAVEESIYNSMLQSAETQGRDGHVRHSLSEYMDWLYSDTAP